MKRLYPGDLLDTIKLEWSKSNQIYTDKKHQSILPQDDHINYILETSYHASFLTEEDKKIQFSIVINYEDNIDLINKYNHFSIVKFELKRKFEPIEIAKLAHATKIENTIIGVIFIGNIPYIWGLINIGDSWSNSPFVINNGAILPPNFFTVTVQKPGSLNISRRGLNILTLSNGYIEYPITNCFSEGPINKFFKTSFIRLYNNYRLEVESEEIFEEHLKLYENLRNEMNNDDFDEYMLDYELDFEAELYTSYWRNYVGFLKGILNNISKTKQGGSLLVLEKDQIDQQLDSLKIKYKLEFNEISEVLLQTSLLQQKRFSMSFSSFENETSIEKFKKYNENERKLEKWNNKFREIQDMIASFSLVDGTIIMDNSFNLLGFGAIVEGQSEQTDIYIAKNSLGDHKGSISSETYGTRHRALFRFCSNNENSLAFILSKDGGIKVVTRINEMVTMWDSFDLENA